MISDPNSPPRPPRGDLSAPRGAVGRFAESLAALPWKDARAEILRSAERAYLVAVLTACGGVVGASARHAGLSPRSLYDKMKVHGLRKEDFRRPAPARSLDAHPA